MDKKEQLQPWHNNNDNSQTIEHAHYQQSGGI